MRHANLKYLQYIPAAIKTLPSRLRNFRSARLAPSTAFLGKLPHIRARGQLQCGKRLVIRGDLFPSSIDIERKGTLHIGDRVFINQGVRIFSSQRVRIGSRTEIGDLVSITDSNFHSVAPRDPVKSAAVEIGPDCWIGSSATILPGTHLGRGCVVAAAAVVNGHFPPGSLLAGVPASVVRSFEVPQDFRRR